MPQFPHHSKLCHCCQSIAHLSPEIMAKKSTKHGDLTLTEKLFHGDFPTGELFFQPGCWKKKKYSQPSLSLDISRVTCAFPRVNLAPKLSLFTAEWPFCPLETFSLKVSFHSFSELQAEAWIHKQPNMCYGTVKKWISKSSIVTVTLQEEQ